MIRGSVWMTRLVELCYFSETLFFNRSRGIAVPNTIALQFRLDSLATMRHTIGLCVISSFNIIILLIYCDRLQSRSITRVSLFAFWRDFENNSILHSPLTLSLLTVNVNSLTHSSFHPLIHKSSCGVAICACT